MGDSLTQRRRGKIGIGSTSQEVFLKKISLLLFFKRFNTLYFLII